MQLVALKEPAPVEVKLTVPEGEVIVPGELSVTVAVHVEDWPTTTELVHETAVALLRLMTEIVAVLLLLPE